jgi:hypothetical protein
MTSIHDREHFLQETRSDRGAPRRPRLSCESSKNQISDDRHKKINIRLSPPVIFSAAFHVSEYLRLPNSKVLGAQFSIYCQTSSCPSQPGSFACLIQKIFRGQDTVIAVSIRRTLQCNRIFSSAPKFIVLLMRVFHNAASRQQIPCHERFTPCYETRYLLTF